MKVKYLLYVEDRIDQQLTFRDAVADWNAAHAEEGRAFEYEIRDDYPSGLEALTRFRFDGALVDLRLPSLEEGEEEAPIGNDLAEKVLRGNGIPVAIITANDAELEPEFQPSETMKVFHKGDADVYDSVIAWFADKWTMMEVLAAAKAHIRSISAEVFADRLWHRWADYVGAAGASVGDLTPVVTRQYVWHLSEVLGIGGEAGDLWHPFENWISPPLQPNRAHTGDVFEIDGVLWVVMSPPCDMANDGNITDVLLVRCDRDELGEWNDRIAKLKGAANPDQIKKHSEWFRKLVNQSRPGQHFLPPLPDDPRPLMVQFANITTRPFAELQGMLQQRKASVSAPFLANLTQRFGSYISRVGQPNIDVMHFS